ncbi:MAG: hypothetical protein IT237_00920 [Bacteroidia bacterium]|nr:hypothetical protein [Bacteroidia bacterium]
MLKIIFILIVMCNALFAQEKEAYITEIENYKKENKIKKAYRVSRKFYNKFPKDTSAIKYYAYQMEYCFYEKKQEKIIRLYDELISIDTNNIHFYNLKIAYLLRREYFNDGISLAKKTLTKYSNLETHRFIALLYEGNNDTLNADLNFTEALKIDSINVFLNYTIGQTMYYRKNYYKASTYFLKYFELAKKNSFKISPAIIPDIIISLWYINDKEKAFYFWKTYFPSEKTLFNYRFNNNSETIKIKKYCEDRLMNN